MADSVPSAGATRSIISDAHAPSAGVSAGSVFIKLAGARTRFAEVAIFENDTGTRLAKRASRELEWGTTAASVDLFLVKQAGDDEPSAAMEEEALTQPRLGVARLLSSAGVVSGAWVIARLLEPLVAAPGECAHETVMCSTSWRPQGRARDSAAWRGAPLSLSVTSLPIPSQAAVTVAAPVQVCGLAPWVFAAPLPCASAASSLLGLVANGAL